VNYGNKLIVAIVVFLNVLNISTQ